MNIIKAVNLVFDYIRRDEEGQVEEVKRALDHVNLEIEKGSFVAILGHNGSGKSTFAKQINGILSPTDGTLFVSEMDTRDEAQNILNISRQCITRSARGASVGYPQKCGHGLSEPG